MKHSYSIPLLIPSLPTAEDILPYLQRIDRHRWYTNFGPLVGEFEERVLNLFRIRQGEEELYLTTVSSGTLGLELALTILNLPTHARILVPAFTFVATATAVVRCGLQPILADVDRTNWLLTPEIALQVLHKTPFEAVIPVATFGCPQDVERWEQFYAETGIPVIVDAAGAFGNQRIGKNLLTVFSLHATKTFGVGEGGIVASGNEEQIQVIRNLSNFGIEGGVGGVKYLQGTNAKMSEYHAALGLAVLDTWQIKQERYRELYLRYLSQIREFCPWVTIQDKPDAGVYATFSVLLPENLDNRRVAVYLNQQGIETRFWYCSLVNNHARMKAVYLDDSTVVNSICNHIIGLPFHLDMTREEVKYVIHHLREKISQRE